MPERSNASNEEFLVNPLGPIEINIKNWYIVVVNETKFIVQIVKKIASTKFEVAYYNKIPLTENRKFMKCNRSNNNFVEYNQIEKRLEPPRVLRGGKVVFLVGLLNGINLQ